MFTSHDEQGRTLAPVKATSKPYKIKGKWYHPQPHYEYEEVGIASFYGGGDVFHGRPTATGERFDMMGMTAAHKTVPLPCMAEVTNLENGRSIQVKVNDRGPFIGSRIIDLSRRGAQLLGFEKKGITKVRVRTLVPETLAMNNLPAGESLYGPSDTVMVAEETKAAPEIAALEFETPTVMNLQALEDGEYMHATLPPPPKIQDLPRESSPRIMSGIYVDVGTVPNQAAGHRMASPLSDITDVSVVEVGSGDYAVRMGPIASLSDADRLADHLVHLGHDAPRIIRNR